MQKISYVRICQDQLQTNSRQMIRKQLEVPTTRCTLSKKVKQYKSV